MTDLEKKERNVKINKKFFKVIGVILIFFIFFLFFVFKGEKEIKSSRKTVEYEEVYTIPYITTNLTAHAIYSHLKNNLPDSIDFEIISTSALFKLSNGMFYQNVTFNLENNVGVLTPTNLTFLMKGTGFETVILSADTSENTDKMLDVKGIKKGKGYRKNQIKKVEIKKALI